MRSEKIFRPSSLVKLILNWIGYLEVPSRQVFKLLHSLSTAALAPRIFIASVFAMGSCTIPQWKLFFGVVHVLLCFFLDPCAFADVHSFGFLRAFACRRSVGLLHSFILHWKEPRTFRVFFEVRRSPGGVDSSKGPLFGPASCNLVLSSFQAAISSCFCVFESVDHSSGQMVSSRVCRPFTQLYSFWGLILKIWKRVVPIHSSESQTSLSSFQLSLIVIDD